MTETKSSALALVPSRALIGTIEDKIRAFDQVAANIASLGLNGWDTVQKAKAGCWLADGKDEHPAVFMENHWVLLIKGRLTIEPKWEYMVRKLKETVPGFRFKVLIETDDCAKVWMTDGLDEHEVEYTLEDAKRQGLLGRGENAWTTGSTREMCLKQAIKRCARRIGVGRGVPWVEVEDLAPPNGAPAREPSTAEVIEDAIEKVGRGEQARHGAEGEGSIPSPGDAAGVTHGAVPEKATSPASPADASSAHTRLSALIKRHYGNISKKVALEKCALLYNTLQKERTGTDPNYVRWTRADQIGPVEAAQIADWLEAYMAKKGAAPPGATVEAKPAPTPSHATVVDEDEPPAAETADEPEAPEDSPAQRRAEDACADLVVTVERARKLFGKKPDGGWLRSFIKEAPPGSGKLYYVDEATFQEAGDRVSLKLTVGPDVVAPLEKLDQLNKILADVCDEKERGR